MTSVNTVLELRDVGITFPGRASLFSRQAPDVKAVEHIDLDVLEGECLGLVGESGCGKTSLGRALVGVYPPSTGTIHYRSAQGERLAIGKPDAALRHRLSREIRMIFQDPYGSLNPRMTVLDIVAEPLRMHGVRNQSEIEDRVAQLLKRVGIRPEMMSRYPHAFSGGQRQRIGIARTLAPGPRVIVADEAVSALDVSVRAQVLNLLLDLKEEFGLTVIFIGHDLGVVRYFCDRVAVMYAGRLVEVAAAETLFQQPVHPYTEALLSAVPEPDPALRGNRRRIVLQGEVPDPANKPSGCAFHPRCRYAQGDRCRQERPLLTGHQAGRVACHYPLALASCTA